MSKQTPMTRWYWRQVGGTLCEGFLAGGKKNGGNASWTAWPCRGPS